MTCQDFRRHHLDYTDGALESALHEELRAHEAQCAACARLHVALLRGLLLARNIAALRPSRAFRNRLRSELDVTTPPRGIAALRARCRGTETRLRLA